MSNAETSQSGALSYLETFSLRCEPFADDIDSRFFYAGTTLMQRLDLLTHLTQFGEAVVLVSGAPGSGKTTLLTRFVEQTNSQWRLCLIDGADDFAQFPQRLAEVLALGSVSSEQQLLGHWVAQTDNSQLLVILVDDADQLDESALARLSALCAQPWANRIRIILFGVPEAQQRLKQAFEQGTSSTSTQQLEMPRLSEEETSSYLMYRLAVAGYSGESPFTPTEVRALCKAAGGRPSDINRLAHEALLERHARKTSKRIPPSIGKRKSHGLLWALGSVGIVVLAIYLGWQRFYPAPGDDGRTAGQQLPIKELPLNLPEPATVAERPPLALDPVRESSESAVEAAPQPEEAAAPPPVAETPPAPSTPEAPETLAESADAQAGMAAQPEQTARSPLSDVAAKAQAALSQEPSPVSTQPVAAEADTTDQEIALTMATPSAETPASAENSPDKAQAAEVATGVVAQPAASADGAAGSALPHREAWLLEQPETSFSLQLLGSRNEQSIAGYIRQNQLDEQQAAYYRGLYQGGAWYVLMYGVYPNKEAAVAGRDALPVQVRKAKPWPRQLKSVHESIREAR
jgi:DamX protein